MRYVVISVNSVAKYSYYLPIVSWAWRRYGWTPFLMFEGELNRVAWETMVPETIAIQLNPVPGINSDTLVQVARLFACNFIKEGYIMTSDADMIPLSNYFNPKEDCITCYGRDLTDYHYPMCFIGMPANKWREVTDTKMWEGHDKKMHWIERALQNREDARSSDNQKRWVADQNIITEYLIKYGIDQIIHENRGMYPNGYPIGRIDRSAWSLDHQQYIDCHAPHDVLENPESFDRLMAMLHKVWPSEDWQWMIDYTEKFKKSIQ